MSNTMHINGWIIEASETDGVITVTPVNDDKVRVVWIQSNKHYTVADVVIVDDKAKQLSIKNEVTIYHPEKVEVKKVGE